jgi:hypothetical protein
VERSSPSTYSIVRKRRPVGVAQVVEAADVLVGHLARDAQFVVELRQPGVADRDAVGQELQRTGWSSVRSSARYTSPIPPRPSSDTRR